MKDIRDAARALGRTILVVNAGTEQEIHRAYAEFARARIEALLVPGDPAFTTQRPARGQRVTVGAMPRCGCNAAVTALLIDSGIRPSNNRRERIQQ